MDQKKIAQIMAQLDELNKLKDRVLDDIFHLTTTVTEHVDHIEDDKHTPQDQIEAEQTELVEVYFNKQSPLETPAKKLH